MDVQYNIDSFYNNRAPEDDVEDVEDVRDTAFRRISYIVVCSSIFAINSIANYDLSISY